MRQALSTIVVVALLAAACGDDAAGNATTTPSGSTTAAAVTTAPTTTAATSTTVAPATTTTLAVTTTAPIVFAVGDLSIPPPVLGSAGDPHGSGCVIGDTDVLPDGIWMGFAEAVSFPAGAAGTITFDLACYFSGAAADAAANADYGGTAGAEEGFHIRNQNPKSFAVQVSPEAEVYSIDAAGPTWFPEPIPLSSWPSPSSWLPCPGETCAVWLFVNGGAATAIVEVFLP